MATITTGLLCTLLLLAGLLAKRAEKDLVRRRASMEELREHCSREPLPVALAQETMDGAALRVTGANRVLDELQCIYPLHVVFSPPKTGCSTLAATIGSLDFCSNLRAAHYLSGAGLDGLQERAYAMADPLRRPRLLRHVRECRALDGILQARRLHVERMGLGDHPFAKPWVVSSVREPVAMALSSFFFSRGHTMDENTSRKPGPTGEFRAWMASQRESLALERWLEQELGGVFGIDPFAQPFPTDKGWICGENESVRFLLLRLESFARLPEALAEFYGIPPGSVDIVSENRASDRHDHDSYESLRGELHLPRESLEQLYASRYVRHFYSSEEIEGFMARWKQPSP